MPSSFDSMYEQTRPRRLLDEHPRPAGRVGATLASVLLIVLPLVAVILL